MPLTQIVLLLGAVPVAAAAATSAPAARAVAPATPQVGPYHLELELPIALATRPSGSGARGEVAGLAGGRAGLALDLGAWCAAAELGLLVGVPTREGSDELAVLSQDSALEAGLRLGRVEQARGFVARPYVRAAGLAGLHLAQLDVAGEAELVARPVWGVAVAAGLIAGRGAWSLRWDLGWQLTSRTAQAVATVGLGYRW